MKPKVLIVEDERRLRELVADYLEEEGFDWRECARGDLALDAFRQHAPNLVILDILMPGLDGYDVCEAIRKESDVPIVFLTAKSEEDDKLLGYDLGADDYVTKPFSPKVLVAKIKALLKRAETAKLALPPAAEAERMEMDGLSLDMTAREAALNGKPLELSPKEFDLLLHFARNRNRVLSRDMLLDAVWGYDYEGYVRTVDTYVKRLRQKLGDRADLIVTLRGNGYRMKVAP
ncbi:response regulator transcription factor [Paenibacillus arenilitoris]|uniref:Response regulator transcription factor n=1 Tax=Paenibacillus arenilitoris TaxID=2772299 RepID=A0A927H7T4_9BACL|nr:response regulator transcription factor [Paenibacillus arenilitoris]MBD2871355.1 response regulator transcription factor [Paenibacillus arenilitoris]